MASICLYIYIYKYKYIYVVCVCEREREREREGGERERDSVNKEGVVPQEYPLGVILHKECVNKVMSVFGFGLSENQWYFSIKR